MKGLRDLAIKQKLLAVTMLTIAVSVLLIGVGVVLSDNYLFRIGMQRDLSALAAIVGDNSTAALSFEGQQVATETLTALKARPHIVSACIYRPDGPVFAFYSRTTDKNDCGPQSEQEDNYFTPAALIASHPIVFKGKQIGTLVITSDLGELSDRTKLYIEIVLAILLSSSIIAFVISTRLRLLITEPISRLAKAAASVSQTGNYAVRVHKDSRDELGVLVDAFNEMLSRVESRDLEVQNARQSLQTTLISIADAVISTDLQGRVRFVNPVAMGLLGLQEKDIVGRSIDAVFRMVDENSRHDIDSPIQRVLQEGSTFALHSHAILLSSGGAEFPIQGSAAPIRNSHDETTGVVLVFRDITSRRATEKLLETQATELRQRAQMLKEADERKDQFLAMLAHELRNPLAPIRNAAQILEHLASGNDVQLRASAIIERQTRQLTHLVDDLLDVSRITRGRIQLQSEPLRLASVIQHAVETSGPAINARRQKLSIAMPQQDIWLKGDSTRLIQVVSNLLNNAAKFTPEGGQIELEGMQDGNQVVIRVRDNGIGLPAELIPHVFEIFTQADRSLDRSQGGLGIGLAVARNLVELHGGHIEARSEGLGKGSEFTVHLPLSDFSQDSGSGARRADKAREESGKLRILVLEDNVDSAMMLQSLLALDGHEVRIAYDGESGLKEAQVFHPQVILCDIGLPGMNGFELAARIRANPEFQNMLLIAITGYSQEEDRLRSREAGFDYHLTKPVDLETLATLLGPLPAVDGS